ncbi:MAG: cytochrome b [Rhodocyclaceae bacterium]|nr:cytochrome b [Rhodocyclaceae bacterium]
MSLPRHTRYDPVAITLHWLVAIVIVCNFALGVYMHELPLSPWKLKIYSWHKWAGVSAFLLVALRLAWRRFHTPPPMPESMPAWQRQLAQHGHHLLYLLMFAVPISGWLMSSALGVQTVYFGALPIPDLLDKDKELGEVLKQVHEALNLGMAAIVLGHAGAALKHHYLDRDDVLTRMLPWSKTPRNPQ